ncbi:MAG: SRPBCC domain-containing protein [Chitinophagaceae bacterium]|jgi:uncharacterized protein YndB with AHSA1/START domain
MKTLNFSTEINAGADIVWFALWDDVHYRKWTTAFHEGSHYKTDWKEGGRIHFLDPQGNGMYSNITKNQPYEKMFFTHIGEIKNFEEQPLDEASRSWTNAEENYTLSENNGVTTLTVTLNVVEDERMIAMFAEAFPKGLAIVKESAEDLMITVETSVNAPVEKVWESWTKPESIMEWNSASPDWHTPKAENDLREGGKFSSTMAAKDGSMSFDFWGNYTKIIPNELIEYTLGDGRKVSISFKNENGKVHITESFQPESQNTLELQKGGWQAIMDNFKQFVESKN